MSRNMFDAFMKSRRVIAIFLLSAFVLVARASEYNIGVYYFPGWKNFAAPTRPLPWDPIKNYPERRPLLGWYPEGDDAVTLRHLNWMSEFGINFIVYDWYWARTNEIGLSHAVDSYLRVSPNNSVKFAILWANHSVVPQNISQFEEIVRYWVAHYFSRPDYVEKSGMPMVVIFSPSNLERSAKSFGSSSTALLNRANEIAKESGLKGIYFVGAVQSAHEGSEILPSTGYQAATAYNYPYAPFRSSKSLRKSENYVELVNGYSQMWEGFSNGFSLKYFPPVTAGWDSRPWSGNRATEHDRSGGDAANFQRHLELAKKFVDANSKMTENTILVCCWNEFGEGSYIEPTVGRGFKFLEIIRNVFGK